MAFAIIVAAGSGLRMRNRTRKQYIELVGIPVLARTLGVFANHPQISSVFLVIPEDDADYCREHILPLINSKSAVSLVPGGEERQDSVYNGLQAAEEAGDIAVIHDGVRPFVTAEMITACIEGAVECGACIVGIPASDTLKRVGTDGIIEKTLLREGVWLAQTPQAFDRNLIRNAYAHAFESGIRVTDDAAAVEHYGNPVRMITGSTCNIKITTPADLEFASALITGCAAGNGNARS